MKLATHEATALALSYLLYRWTRGAVHPVALLYGALVSVVEQRLIDAVGHNIVCRRGRCYPARNKVHSLPAVVAIGLALSAPLLATGTPLPYALAPLAGLILHWVEDLVTEGGVYLLGGRVRLGGFSYDSHWVNSATLLSSIALLLLFPPQTSLAVVYWVASLGYVTAAITR